MWRLPAAGIGLLVVAGGCWDQDDYTADGHVVRWYEDVAAEIELEPGQHTTAPLLTHCGYETLTVDINGQTWTTAELPEPIPQEPTWPNGVERAVFRLALLDDETLKVTAEGSEVSLTYRPDPDPPSCA
jgi:hypothetical protein